MMITIHKGTVLLQTEPRRREHYIPSYHIVVVVEGTIYPFNCEYIDLKRL